MTARCILMVQSSLYPMMQVAKKIFDIVLNQSEVSEISALSLYVYRQMDKIDWLPFVKAAIERNPVCLTSLTGKTDEQAYSIIEGMPDESIYDGNRLALPDEVWNFNRGDGVEKALLLSDFLINKDNSLNVSIILDNKNVLLKAGGKSFISLQIKTSEKPSV